jgi:hypothetical protein
MGRPRRIFVVIASAERETRFEFKELAKVVQRFCGYFVIALIPAASVYHEDDEEWRYVNFCVDPIDMHGQIPTLA